MQQHHHPTEGRGANRDRQPQWLDTRASSPAFRQLDAASARPHSWSLSWISNPVVEACSAPNPGRQTSKGGGCWLAHVPGHSFLDASQPYRQGTEINTERGRLRRSLASPSAAKLT